jgi:hypothetical protein
VGAGPGIFFAAFRRAQWPFRQGPHLPVIILAPLAASHHLGGTVVRFSDEASTVGSFEAPKSQEDSADDPFLRVRSSQIILFNLGPNLIYDHPGLPHGPDSFINEPGPC